MSLHICADSPEPTLRDVTSSKMWYTGPNNLSDKLKMTDYQFFEKCLHLNDFTKYLKYEA